MDEASLLFLKGAATGALLAAPLGVLSAIALGRARAQGFGPAAASGLGAACADAVFAATAAYVIAALLPDWLAANSWARQFGGMMLLWLAWQAFNAPLLEPERPDDTGGLAESARQTFILAIGNAPAFAAFSAIFVALGVDRGGADGALAVSAGIFAGAFAWRLALAAFGGAMGPAQAQTVNRVAAALLAVSAFAVAGAAI